MEKMEAKKNTNFWIGTEVEGKFKGIRTLFVKGNQSIYSIQRRLLDNSIFHIYFGAGNQTSVNNWGIILYFLKNNFLVTLEVKESKLGTIPDNLFKYENLHVIIMFKNKNIFKLRNIDSIKLEDDKNVFMIQKECFIKTNKRKDYKGDKLI